MKRFIAMFLVVVMMGCMFAGCGRNNDDEWEKEQWEQGGGAGNAGAVEGPAPTEAPETEPQIEETEAPYVPQEEASYFYFYDYKENDYTYSDIYTYHYVTGATALYSALDFGFLSEEDYEYIVYGYDDRYAVFIYEYSKDQMERYEEYLVSRGYTYQGSESYTDGKSRFYKNESNGYQFDLFVGYNSSGSPAFIAIEPYMNGTMN